MGEQAKKPAVMEDGWELGAGGGAIGEGSLEDSGRTGRSGESVGEDGWEGHCGQWQRHGVSTVDITVKRLSVDGGPRRGLEREMGPGHGGP